MSEVRAGFINSPVPGKGGRKAGRRSTGEGQGRMDRHTAVLLAGFAVPSHALLDLHLMSNNQALLPSLRKRNCESINLIWNKSLGGAKLALGMSAVLCGSWH